MTRFGRIRLFLDLGVYLCTACFVAWLASAQWPVDIESPASGWRRAAGAALAVVGLLMVGAPFLLEHLFTGVGAEHLRARGKEPRAFVLRGSFATSGAISIIGLVLLACGGRPVIGYVASTLTVASLLFWAWRYRGVLGSSGPRD